MARTAAKPKKEVSMEEALWKSADKLRGSVEPAEYKHVVLSLFFLKFASDKFEAQRAKIIANGQEKFADMVAFYTKDNVFFLPPECRWSYIMENAKQEDIALKIDTALYTIEKTNPALKGALPDNYYSRLGIDTAKLASLLDEINKINTDDQENDIIGRVYEYFLGKFALAEGKGKGEFYTPKCIVNLIAEMIEPYSGILYDPCCGSGGMFVQSVKFVEAHRGNKKNISIYGQEYTSTTYKLAKMNLAIRGISANLGEQAANTFTNDQHKDLKADFIMANPPFNQKEWRGDGELVDDPRWDGYEVPPTSNANYGWILNIVKRVNKIMGVEFSERLKRVVDEYNNRRRDEAFANEVLDDVAEQLAKLLEELKTEKQSFEKMGIDYEEKAFYDILKAVAKKYEFDDEYPDEKMIELSKRIKTIVDDQSRYTDWSTREDIKATLQVDLIILLDEFGYPPVTIDDVYKEVLEQAENFKKYAN